jgi:hypothetical protein
MTIYEILLESFSVFLKFFGLDTVRLKSVLTIQIFFTAQQKIISLREELSDKHLEFKSHKVLSIIKVLIFCL